MAALHQAAKQARAKPGHKAGRWPLLGQPRGLVAYLALIVVAYLAAIVVASASVLRGPGLSGVDLITFVALLACGAVCIEAGRRLGMPAGIARDLLSAWWIPMALLLPPIYALLAPIPLHILSQLRVRQTVIYRRVFTAAAIGLAGGTASLAFHTVVPAPLESGWLLGATAPHQGLLAAMACAALFPIVNMALVAVAAHMADPETRWREVLWDRESLMLDVVEVCVGLVVAVACAVSVALLLFALPPVVLLQRSLLHAQLQAAARTDAKTGLLNAAAWQREAATEISRAQRTGNDLALLIIDIDHFKRVNDQHGHLAGDEVLAGVAAALRTQLREYDIVGRFGGEEFVVLLPQTETLEACRVANRLRARISGLSVVSGGEPITVTISAGVAIMGIHGDDLIELLAAADLALYQAKEEGRDRVCLPVTAKEGPRSP